MCSFSLDTDLPRNLDHSADDATRGLEALYQSRLADDGMVLEVLIHDQDGNAPTTDTLLEWADNFGLTMPVLSDAGEHVVSSYAGGWHFGPPFVVVLDKGDVISAVDGSEAEWEALF